MSEENAPVDPAEWAAVEAGAEKALGEYRKASDRRDEAERALRALQCRAQFTYGIPGPDGEDEAEIEEECARPAGHDGDHTEDDDLSDDVPEDYVRAVTRYLEEVARTNAKGGAWQLEDDRLETLRCNNNDSDGGWPCVRRRGHQGTHEHPPIVSLVR